MNEEIEFILDTAKEAMNNAIDHLIKELRSITLNDDSKLQLAVLKIENSELKGQQVLSTSEFASYKQIIKICIANIFHCRMLDHPLSKNDVVLFF